jgi:hypothetical protein
MPLNFAVLRLGGTIALRDRFDQKTLEMGEVDFVVEAMTLCCLDPIVHLERLAAHLGKIIRENFNRDRFRPLSRPRPAAGPRHSNWGYLLNSSAPFLSA